MTQSQDYQDESQQYDGAAMMEEIINRQEYKQATTYTPFEGTDDNQVTLTPGMVLRFYAKPTRNGHICPYEQAVRFIMLCKARKLDPREGDAYLVGFDTKNGPEFNLITAHQAFLKRAESNKNFDGMESGVVVQNEASDEVIDIAGDFIPDGCKLVGGWSRVHRKDRKIQTYRRIPLAPFKKNFGVWLENAAGMIVKCAEADGLRSTFPNTLGGMYIQDEVSPIAHAPETPTRKSEVAKAIEQAKNTPPGDTRGDAHPPADEPKRVDPPASPAPTPLSPAGDGAPTATPPARRGRPPAVKKAPESPAEPPSAEDVPPPVEAPKPLTKEQKMEQAREFSLGDIGELRQTLAAASVNPHQKLFLDKAKAQMKPPFEGLVADATEAEVSHLAYLFRYFELSK